MFKCLSFRLVLLPAAMVLACVSSGLAATNAITVTNKPPAKAVQQPPLRCPMNYPENAMRDGIEGTTTVSLTVTPQGTATNVKVLTSSGNADLDAATLACASEWKFSPAKIKGVAVEFPWQGAVEWSLHTPPFPWRASWVKPEPTGPNRDCSSHWPRAARRDHAEGTTTLFFRVAADGKVKNAKVLKSSGDQDLDDAAVECAEDWEYLPATNNGAPIEVIWETTIEWMIGDTPIPKGPYPVCTSFVSPVPATLPERKTTVDYQLMPDGTAHSKRIVMYSGNIALDQAAVRCIEGSTFDISSWKVPPEGLAEQAIIDWKEQFSATQPSQ